MPASPKISRARRIVRLAGRTLAFVAIVGGGVVGYLTLTQTGRDQLASTISSMASTPESGVQIGPLRGIWSGNLVIGHVLLSDAKGPWLLLRDVEVDWSPLALVSSHFRADRVRAARVEFARLPEGGSGEGTGGLPVSLEISRFDFPDIAIGSDIAGGVAAVKASGALTASADLARIGGSAAVERTDGQAGRVDVSVDFAAADQRLEVDLVASEPAGGIIANMLALPGKPAVELVVSGAGPATKWSGKATFAVDGQIVTRVDAVHSQTSRGRRIEAKGDGQFERFLPASVRPLAAGASTFDFAGTLLAQGGLELDAASFRSAAATVSGRGTVDPQGGSDFALELATVAGPVRLTFGEGEEPVSLALRSAAVRAFGPGSTPMVDVSASLADLTAPGHRFADVQATAHSDAFDIVQATGPMELSLTAASGGSVNDTVAALLAGALSVDARAEVAANRLTVSSGALKTGTVDATFAGQAARDGSTFTIDLVADAAAAALPAGLRPALDRRVALTGNVAREADGAIVVKGLDLKSGALAVGGTLRLAGDDIDADLTGSLADVGRLSPGASGAVDFTARLDGRTTAPAFSAEISANRIEAAGRAITGLALSATGVADAANPSAKVTLAGDVAGSALSGGAEVATEGEKRVLKGLDITLGPNRIAGDLTLDAGWVPEGDIVIDLPDLGPLAALAFEEASGGAKGKLSFARGAVPSVTVDLTAPSVRRGDLAAEAVAVAASVENYLAAPAISGRIRAGGVTSGGANIRSIDVTLTRDAPWTGFVGGATVNAIPATATGRLRFDEGGATIVELQNADATVFGLKPSLARPTVVTIAGGTTTLDKMALAIGGGRLTISGTAGEQLALNAEIGGLPAGVINTFAPGLGAAGIITGTARILGPAADPAVGYTLDWKAAETTQTREAGFGAMQIRSTGDMKNGSLAFKASVGDGSGLNMSGGGTVALTGGPRLSVEFGGKVPFGFLTRRLAAQGLSLTGVADVSLNVSGAAAAPTVTGTIRAGGARFIDARSGIAVNDLAADIAVGAGVATVRSLTGALSTGGALSASGTVGIDAGSGFPADLTLSLQNGRYTDGKLVTASLGGQLKLTGPLVDMPLVSGTIDLGKTVVTVPESLPLSLSRLGVEHRNASPQVRRQTEALQPAASSGGGGGLRLDVTLSAPQQIFVQGRGIDVELGGALRLAGTSAAPQATGDFTLRRGRLSLLGRRLDFTRGTLSFSGSMVPYIDLAADSVVGDATVTVLVTGFADNPKFSFSSIPTLPEDEILARLIFGRSMSNLSPLQIAQLAEAAAQIAGVGGPTSLLETLRSKIGVDDLDVKTDEATGDTAVSAGKYLNDRTYVTVEKGEKAGSGKATIDLNVGRGVKLRGEAGEDGRAKGGIFFEREY